MSVEDVIARTIVGESQLIRELRELIAIAAPSEEPVLIRGETGSGKELVAKALHDVSKRSGEFVTVNICAIPDSLFESEVFGYAKGAFTGAEAQRSGLMAEANGGTLFLDEIGELSNWAQAKLLRAIERREFRPLGAGPRTSSFRAVAATNKALDCFSSASSFRPDLWFRLASIMIDVPCLSDRMEDVPLLSRHFLSRPDVNGGRVRQLTPSGTAALLDHTWPGNVRELRAVLVRAALFASNGVVEGADIERALVSQATNGRQRTNHSVERFRLRDALARAEGDTARAAAELEIDRTTFYRRCKKLGIRISAKGKSRLRL